MNEETPPSDLASLPATAATTLQAILLFGGAMDSIAVPVPLPEVILRVESGRAGAIETRFRRERSADSVIRYVAEGPPIRDETSPRRCARCGESRSVYYVPKLRSEEPVTSEASAYCEACYGAVIP